MNDPIYTTVAFKSVDRDAFKAFWLDIRTRYKFAEGDAPTQAFAVSMGDMFAEQEAVQAILASDLDYYEMKEAIGEVVACDDIPGLLVKWEVEPLA